MVKNQIQWIEHDNSLLIFDGVCVLCNKLIRFVHRLDKKGEIHYSDLKTNLPAIVLKNQPWILTIDSVVFLKNGDVNIRSNAILNLLTSLKGLWSFALICYVIPRFLRDILYKIVAKSRYKLFGKFESCPIPDNSLKLMIIDWIKD